MRKNLFLTLLALILSGLGYFLYLNRPKPALETKFVQNVSEGNKEALPLASNIINPANYALVENTKQIYQTFNNCGPATLSMVLSFYGKEVSQKELGDLMRPYQIPSGDNDDKTIFTSEFSDWAQKYGFSAVSRVNGDIDILKKFTANGIPVVVKTWLKVGEDIGHFRIVRGFDDTKQVIIQDDSYDGPNKKISYYDFLSIWQPFNYAYIIVYTPDLEEKVLAIVGEDVDESTNWNKALARAEKERELTPENIYPLFNLSTTAYHLGDYKKSVEAFEQVENLLPRRMLWYQIEPILAYQKLLNYSRVFEITDKILAGGNHAFSELYLIRGEVYLSQGEKDKAKTEFEQAVSYNKNLEKARQALADLN